MHCSTSRLRYCCNGACNVHFSPSMLLLITWYVKGYASKNQYSTNAWILILTKGKKMRTDLQQLLIIFSSPLNVLILFCSVIFIIAISIIPFYSQAGIFDVTFSTVVSKQIYSFVIIATVALTLASLLGERTSSLILFPLFALFIILDYTGFAKDIESLNVLEVTITPRAEPGFYLALLSCLGLIACNFISFSKQDQITT